MALKLRKLKILDAPPKPAPKPLVKAVPKPVVKPAPQPPPEMPSGGKDFSDILIVVLDAGERIYHLDHRRNLKTSKLNGTLYIHNGHKYLLNLDRCFKGKWAPWKKFLARKPYLTNTYRFFNEVARSKKIGMLLFQEPCTNRCASCNDKDGEKCKKIPDIIEPIHTSRIHQPSGRMMG